MSAPAQQPLILTPAQAREDLRKRAHAKRQNAAKTHSRMEHPGRRTGIPHGTYVTDIAEVQKAVVLCWKCQHRFDPRPYNYYHTREFNIFGRCDGCKQHSQGAQLFIHESALGRKHGQCWTPR